MKNHKISQKHFLLPLPIDYARHISLVAHLALAVCRAGQGNRHQLYQLIRTTYLSYILWKDGHGNSAYELYRDAEEALEAAAEHAYSSDDWMLHSDAAAVIQHVIATFDYQLSVVSRRRYLHCNEKLEKLLRLEIPGKLNSDSV